MNGKTSLPCQALDLIDQFCREHGLSLEQKNRLIKRYERRLLQIQTERASVSSEVKRLTAEIDRLNRMASEK